MNALLGRIRAASTLARSSHPAEADRPVTTSRHPDPNPSAWMICPPARRGDRTAALGSCIESGPAGNRHLISEAASGNHTTRQMSSSVCIHYEAISLSPVEKSVPVGAIYQLAPRRIVRTAMPALGMPRLNSKRHPREGGDPGHVAAWKRFPSNDRAAASTDDGFPPPRE